MDTGKLIDAAHDHARAYDGDEREGIVTDVMNAFYAGAKFGAQDIERLRAENARLLQNWTQAIEEGAYARKQLLAAQAREGVLREALILHSEQYPYMVKGYTLDAINLPHDTALRELLKAERERIAAWVEREAINGEVIADAIRAMEG